MHNFLSRFKRGSSSGSSGAVTDEKKNKSSNKSSHAQTSGNPSGTYQKYQTEPVQSPSNTKKQVKESNPNQELSSSLPSTSKNRDSISGKKNENVLEQTDPSLPKVENTNLNVFGMIIEPSRDEDDNKSENPNDKSLILQIFDPEPAPAETNTSNQTTYIDDRNFIFDDDEELSHISDEEKLEGLAKENSVFTVNEVPEGRLSKMSSKSSRASSRSSIGSNSTRDSNNILFADQASSDNLSCGLPDTNHAGNEKISQNGSKNVLLDALIKKFNVGIDLDTNDTNSEKANTADSVSGVSETSGPRTSALLVKKQQIKFHGEEHKRKQQSELQRKIDRSNRHKTNSTIADSLEADVDATSSFDDDPKRIKIVKSSSTQITRTLNKRNKNFKTVSVTRLPQNFECKYIGKTRCTGLWGLKHIRDPVDYLVTSSRKLKSLDELPNVEALISEKGIYIVQKSKSDAETKLEETFSPILPIYEGSNISATTTAQTTELPTTSRDEKAKQDGTNGEASLKYYQSGLLPISNISYAVQDNLYGKVFSCIIVRDCDGITISECYSFLCKKNEIARRMALSITLAFKEYGKLLQLKETRINRKIEIHGAAGVKGDSFV